MSILTDTLARCPFVAILRGVKPDEVEAIGDVLVEEGFLILEVPLNSPSPFESVKRLALRLGERALVGAGTVLRPEDASAVARASGRVVVMPHADATVVREAKRLGLVAIPGFSTPTEAFNMLACGADGLKLFPAEGSSPAVLKSMRAVLPHHAPILPVGGIDAGNLAPWLAAGAAGFGIGSALYKAGLSPAEVRDRARRLNEALNDIRRERD